ncbi:MAG: hypothetical protein AAGL98_07250 [Planctomycetota bacterium]
MIIAARPPSPTGPTGSPPDDESAGPTLLCETCGYGLRGLRLTEVCPECGRPIAESLPHHRVGPAWQTQMNPVNGWRVAIAVLRRPKSFFRRLSLDGPNLPARLFLLSIALIVGVGWGLFTAFGHGKPFLLSWVMGMVAAKTVIGMTYIESVGVTFFSRRRGWRVPFGLAERLTCYASVGWILAAVVLGGLSLVESSGLVEDWARGVLGRWGPEYRLLLGAVGFGAAVMGFEILVWTGVRRVRFANAAGAKS